MSKFNKLAKGTVCTTATCLLSTTVVGHALAAPIERNPSLVPKAVPQLILPPNILPAQEDDHPLGTSLNGIVLLGSRDEPITTTASGIDAKRVARLDTSSGLALLQPYLGRPLSRKLIASIEADIARAYREIGFPFVSLSTPPQNISAGILQIRVLEFTTGKIGVHGAADGNAEKIKNQIRLEPDAPINANTLSADLNWINRYPFHRAEAIFTSGDAFGRTDLDLHITESKPWNVYGGYANSGSQATGIDRYFVGGIVGGVITPGSVLSYMFTTSNDALKGSDNGHARYISHGLRAEVPFAPRQQLEATFNHVETNSTTSPFTVRQITDELLIGHRFSLSNISNLKDDLAYGIEVKREQHKTFFSGIDVQDGAVDIAQLYTNWTAVWQAPSGTTSADMRLHISPGGINSDNRSETLGSFTNQRVTNARYEYANLQLSRVSRLPIEWWMSNTIILQKSTRALPDTEQSAIGGADLVRGYSLDDGAYDDVIISRNELHLPSYNPFGAAGSFSPYAFVDGGYGADRSNNSSHHALSAGIALDYRLWSSLTATVSCAHNFLQSASTHAGSTHADVRIMLTF